MEKKKKSLSPREKALKLLARRERTTHEVRTRLVQEGYRETEVDEVIQWLQSLNYLNDARAAKSWVDHCNRFRYIGNLLLAAELRSKGVDEQIVRSVLNDEEAELEIAKSLASRKYRQLAHLPREKCWTKLGGYLARKGFSWEIIRRTLADVLPVV